MYIMVYYLLDDIPTQTGFEVDFEVEQGCNANPAWVNSDGVRAVKKHLGKRHPLGGRIVLQSVVIPSSYINVNRVY